MRTFTIEEIRNYLLAQDSMGDALYNLNEKSLTDASITALKKKQREEAELADLELENEEGEEADELGY